MRRTAIVVCLGVFAISDQGLPALLAETSDSTQRTKANTTESDAKITAPLEHWLDASRWSLRAGQERKRPANVAYVRLAQKFLREQLARSIQRQDSASDDILGTRFTGKALTRGNVDVVLKPGRDKIVAEIVFAGTVKSQMLGYNGPVTLHNTIDTDFRSTKELVVTTHGIKLAPAVSNAKGKSTTSRIDSTLPGLRGRIARRIAWRRAGETRDQVDAIASQHTAVKISKAFDAETENSLLAVREEWNKHFSLLPQLQLGDQPQIQLRSTPEYLEVVLVRLEATDVERKLLPPAAQKDSLISARVHRSMLGGRLNELAVGQLMAPLLAEQVKHSGEKKAKNVVLDAESTRVFEVTWSADQDWLQLEYKPAEPSKLLTTAR